MSFFDYTGFGGDHAGFGQGMTLLLDIASDGVIGTLVFLSKNNPPHIVYSHRQELPERREQKSIAQLLEDTLSATHSVLLDMQKASHVHNHHIKHTHCFFSSPWHASQTKVVTISKATPTIVTERGILGIVDQEKKLALAAQTFAEPLEIIESSVIGIKLNGYETAEPYGKSATEIEITLFISLIGKEFLTKVKECIAAVFAHAIPEFHTFSLAAFSVIRALPEHPADFLLVDAAGEVTDVSIVKRGVILQSLTLPFGQNFFVRGLSKRMHVPYQVALSLFQLHAQGKSDPSTSERVESELKKESVEWQASFHDALQNLSQEAFVPPRVYLISEDQLSPFFCTMVAEQNFSQFSTEKTVLEPVAINEIYLKSQPGQAIASGKATSALLESLFIHTIKAKLS